MSYENMCYHGKFSEKLQRKRDCGFNTDKEFLQALFEHMKPNTFYIAEEGGLPKGCTYHVTVVRGENALAAYTSAEVIIFSPETYIHQQGEEIDWRDVFNVISNANIEFNHYDYADLIIEHFWYSVFGKSLNDMFCGGIVGAHGDKSYGYKCQWEEHGINFNRGTLLYLLTYTKERGETPKYESGQWVIDNYSKYLDRIMEAEKHAGIV